MLNRSSSQIYGRWYLPTFLFRDGLMECDEYIGESSRTFGERFKEHQKAPSPIYNHYNITGHKISLDNISIMGREDQTLMRTIKTALYIRVINPSLNMNVGEDHLPHIWDCLIFMRILQMCRLDASLYV